MNSIYHESLGICIWCDIERRPEGLPPLDKEFIMFIVSSSRPSFLNSFIASGHFCHLLIAFANSLDPDQDQQDDSDCVP